MTKHDLAAKRAIDIVVSLFGLVLLAPLLAVIFLVVRIWIGTPVLFRQQRPGLGAKVFTIVKFRTMIESRDDKGVLLPDSMRLTAVGQFLRSSSLDELPELFNVLIGDMSLVGPRPLHMEYLHLYSERQARRHLVKPGITGWAQVNGRNSLSWEQKFELDNWYVDNWSLLLDFWILIKTVCHVCMRKGISAEGHASMPAFTGTRRADL